MTWKLARSKPGRGRAEMQGSSVPLGRNHVSPSGGPLPSWALRIVLTFPPLTAPLRTGNEFNWEWLQSSTVLFPHDFTRVDHQMENSLNFTLEIDTPQFSRIKVVWLLAFKLKWRWSVFRFPDVGNPACRCRVTSLLGMSFCCCLTGCSVLLNARSSFRVASDFQEFLQRFDEVLVQSSKLGQMLWLRAFWSSPSFKEARDFQTEQRERERAAGSQF